MRALTEAEARSWCEERGLQIDKFGGPRFPHDRAGGFQVLIPKNPFGLPIFTLQFLEARVDELDQLSGVDHLLWLREWGIWGDLMTAMGENLFNRLRLGYGISESIQEKPAMLFPGSEMEALISFALTPLVFGWDCYIIPNTAKHFAFVCHDEWVGVSGKEEAVEAEMIVRLERDSHKPSTDGRLAGIGAI